MAKKIGNKIYNFLVVLDKSQVTVLLFAEMVFGIFLSISSFLIFTKLAKDVLEKDQFGFDASITNFVFQFRDPLATKVMFVLSQFGNDFILVFSFLIIILLIRKKFKHEAKLFGFILAMGFIINTFLKILIGRPRPDIVPLLIEQSYSFPSGHSMNAFVFYVTVAYFIFRFTRNKTLSFFISLLCIMLIVFIGISRIYLGVHYPSDVLAGFIGGFWWFVTALFIEKTIIFFKLYRQLKEETNIQKENIETIDP